MEGFPLLSLSLELLLAICDELELLHLKQLRLACKMLGHTLAAPVLRKLKLPAKSGASLKVTARKLGCLAEATSICSKVTRELKIDNLSSSTYGYLFARFGRKKPETLTPKVESEMRRRIHVAIRSLKAVTTLTWRSYKTDPTWLQVVIWRSIKDLPNLRNLTIDAKLTKCPLDLHSLRDLESISISATPETGADPILHSLAKLYASSLRLTSLSIDISSSRKPPKLGSLHHLFGMYNERSPTHRLRCLSFVSCFVKLDNVTLPHLKHLTSLNLTTEDDYDSRDAFWRTFIGSGIYLEELGYHSTPISLISYLLSYSGLRKLHLEVSHSDNKTSSCKAAAQFFSKGLDNHFDALEDLAIVAPFESPWNFRPDNSMTIAKCRKLRYLKMNIFFILDEEESSEPGPRNLPDDNIIKHFIDLAVTHMPHIQRLVLGGACTEVVMNTGIPRLIHKNQKFADILECIPRYVAPAMCQYLPAMVVLYPRVYDDDEWSEVFISERDVGEHCRLVYVPGPSEEDNAHSSDDDGSESTFSPLTKI